MNLPSLPLEILQQIVDYVEAVHRPSLYAFSLTSKACHRASAILVFQQLHITVHHREGLRQDTERLVEALSRTDSSHHVQRMSIKGALCLKAKKTQSDDQDYKYWRPYLPDQIMDDEEMAGKCDSYVVYDQPVIKKSSEEDMAWAPLVSLIQSIPHLKDLIYDCKNQFPPSLLQTLHELHPQCRLHHLTFRFRTLLWGVPYPYEMELATSPCLYRVKITCSWRDTDYDDDFNEEAIRELAAGLAPNLREVVVLQRHAVLSNRSYRPRDSWKGLPGFGGNKKGSLTSLMIKGCLDLTSPELLQQWATHTDFACLQHLVLGGDHHGQYALSGETMAWVAQNHTFSRVRTLRVHVARSDLYHEKPQYSSNAISFFDAFESLEELWIAGPLDAAIFDAVLSRHGQTLKKLRLRPSEEITQQNYHVANEHVRRVIPLEFTADLIRQIRARCPVLEELAIPVKRDRSSASEAEMYKCFAEMENLSYLILKLDCSNKCVTLDSTYNPHFDDEDRKPVGRIHPSVTRGHFKEMLINCAVDETLARSIWTIVNDSRKQTGRGLERLKLWSAGGGDYGSLRCPSSITDMLDNLSQSWLLERDLRDDRDDILVRELGLQARQALTARTKHMDRIHVRSESQMEMRRMMLDLISRQPAADVEWKERQLARIAEEDERDEVWRRDVAEPWEIFRSIWPSGKENGTDGGRCWQEDWSSFPLRV